MHFKFLTQLLFLHSAISSIVQPNIFLTLVTPELAHSTSEMTKVSHSFINKSNHIVQQQAFSRFNLLESVVLLEICSTLRFRTPRGTNNLYFASKVNPKQPDKKETLPVPKHNRQAFTIYSFNNPACTLVGA